MTKHDLQELTGELRHIDPRLLSSKGKHDKLPRFFLVLAIIYNDLKGLTFFTKQVHDNYRPPVKDELSYHAGEFTGILVQTTRLFAGMVHEFLEYLKENKDVLELVEFKMVADKLNKRNQELWNEIISASSQDKTNRTPFVVELEKIRNEVAFHYNHSATKIGNAYNSFFTEAPKTKFNEKAYYASGDTMRGTRFFYADAAIQEYLRSAKGGSGSNDSYAMEEYSKEMMDMLERMNRTLAALLSAYLRSRGTQKDRS